MDPQLPDIKTITFKPVDAEPESYYSESRPSRTPEYLDDQAGILEYWRILNRRKGRIILIALLVALAAVLTGLPRTPVYRAGSSLEIQDINTEFMHEKQMNPVDSGAVTDIQTQILILESGSLWDRVIEKLMSSYKGTDSAPPSSGTGMALRKLLHLPPPVPAMLQVTPDKLTVRPVGPTRIVELTYESPDPQLAAAVVNTLASEYIESNMEARWKMTEHTGEWLSRQLDEMRGKLERSEADLQAYAQRAGLIFTSGATTEKTNVADEKLIELQAELSRAQEDRVGVQSRYEMTKAVPVDTLPDVLNDSSLHILQDKLTDLRRQEADLIVVYTANDEKVKRVNAQIAPLQAAFDRERKDILDRIHNEYETSLRRESLLRASYAEQSRLVTDQAQKSIQYNILKREVDSNRQVYESMLQQVKEATVASAIRASNVRIVDPAVAPLFQSSPNHAMNGMIGLLTGLLMGTAFVIVRERSNRTLQQPGEAQFWLNVPELGVIRTVTKDRRISYFRRKPPKGQRLDEAAALEPATRSGKERVELVTWHRKPSSASESFRAVLASILFSSQDEGRPKVLVLASATPSEGKTVVACNLAIALGEIQRKVLLIDADLRKPRIHSLFELPNERGLSTFLRERAVTSETPTLEGIVQPTFIPNLFVLPSGPESPTASSLLHSPNLQELLSNCRKEFDTVIIDTPPVKEMSDARVLGSLADAVILVIRAGQTTRAAAAAVAQRFAEDKTRVLGVILNDWDPKTSPRG
jgi:polysaccharide biosynthesis transport protein